MYNIIIKLKTGEYVSLLGITSISWTRARQIFCDNEDNSHVYLAGDIVELNMEVVKHAES